MSSFSAWSTSISNNFFSRSSLVFAGNICRRATLGKGVNRGTATLLGGALGVEAHRLATFSGDKVEPIFLGLSVLLIASLVTFMRFHPKLKPRYDYGLMIIILTVILICVSGYRDDEVLDIAFARLSTVLIGGAASVFICAFIRPVWAGEDLHNLTAANIEKPATFDMKRFGDSIRTLFREVQRGLEVRVSRIIGDLEGTLACNGIIHLKK